MSVSGIRDRVLFVLKLSMLPAMLFSSVAFAQVVCTNGSSTDCNPVGSTINPSAAFVDANPPVGYQQCAGFINTDADDVRWDWENNCIPFKTGDLFMRLFDDSTGAIIAGARLFDGVPSGWDPSTGFNYRGDSYEGEGFLDNPTLDDMSPGTTLGFHETDRHYCGCTRPPSGEGTCNDVYSANAANDKIFYVGGNSTNHNYEALFASAGGKGACVVSNEVVRVRVAVYQGEGSIGPRVPVVPIPAMSTWSLLLLPLVLLLMGMVGLRWRRQQNR